MELEYELQTHRAEDRHWWYQGRRSVLERAIARLGLPAQRASSTRAAVADATWWIWHTRGRHRRGAVLHERPASPRAGSGRGDRRIGHGHALQRWLVRFDGQPRRDRAPRRRCGRAGRAAARDQAWWGLARNSSCLPVAVEWPRRDQPPPPPLQPPHPTRGRPARRLAAGELRPLQLPIAPGRDRFCAPWSVSSRPPPSRASTYGCPLHR